MPPSLLYLALQELFLDTSGSKMYHLFYDTIMTQLQMVENIEVNGYAGIKFHEIFFSKSFLVYSNLSVKKVDSEKCLALWLSF